MNLSLESLCSGVATRYRPAACVAEYTVLIMGVVVTYEALDVGSINVIRIRPAGSMDADRR